MTLTSGQWENFHAVELKSSCGKVLHITVGPLLRDRVWGIFERKCCCWKLGD